MQNLIFLDFEECSKEYLTNEERTILDEVEVELFIDPSTQQIGAAVSSNKIFSYKQVESQDKILQKLMKVFESHRMTPSIKLK